MRMLSIRRLMRWPTLTIATALHYVWGFILLIDPHAIHITALTPLSNFNGRWVGFGLLAIAHLGVWALTREHLSWRTLAALIPQQVILAFSAISGLYFALHGHYGDGVPRPQGFIEADQAVYLILMIFHAIALALTHRPEVHNSRAPALVDHEALAEAHISPSAG